jgi:transglutaminase-like putative cysteine protease
VSAATGARGPQGTRGAGGSQGAGAASRPRGSRSSPRSDAPLARLSARAPEAAFVVLLLALGAAPLWPVYESGAFVAMAVGALVLGGAIAVAGAVWRLPIAAVAALTAVAYLVAGVPLAVPSQAMAGLLPTPLGLRSLVFGTATAWKQMLSVDLPLGSYEALLVPSFIVMLAATVTGVSIVLRIGRPGWASVPAAVLLAFGIAFGARTGQQPVAEGLLFAGVALVWAIVAAHRRRGSEATGGAGTRRLLAALALLVAATVAGGAIVGTWAPGSTRQVLRAVVVPPFDPHHYVSPLVTYRNSVLAPGKTADQLTVSGLPSGARLRVATLDDYDGQVFAQGDSPSSGTFARVASTVVQTGVTGTHAAVTVRVDGYSDVWLPTAGALTSIAFEGSDSSALRDAFYYDRQTSSAAVLGGVARGDRYRFDTIVAAPTTAGDLAQASPGRAAQPKATDVPQALLQAAAKHEGTAASAGAKLAAVAEWLRSGYVSDSGPGEPFSAAGHSASRLTSLVDSTPMLGDAEQYAPALALIARKLGFPSRVVVGYAPTRAQESRHTITLTGADLTAWVEVQAADGRWLTVDPNPTPRPVPDNRSKESQAVAQPQTVQPPPPPTRHDTAVTQNRESQKTKHDAPPPAWLVILVAALRVTGIVLLIAAIVLAPLWSIALARALRRRRRRRLDREDNVVTGAWSEILDDVVDRGYNVPRAATRSEVAALVGAPAVAALAERAERSVFSSQALRDGDVDDYWADTRAARRSLGASDSRWARLRYHLSARSIGRRARGAAPATRRAVTQRVARATTRVVVALRRKERS